MSKNLRKCMKTMHLYCCTEKKPLRMALLNEMSKHRCFFDACHEIVNNLFLKNINLKNLTPAQKKRMKKSLPVLHKIRKKPKSMAIRRKLVQQSGGWIPFVLPILTTIVGELIGNAIRKKSDTSSA